MPSPLKVFGTVVVVPSSTSTTTRMNSTPTTIATSSSSPSLTTGGGGSSAHVRTRPAFEKLIVGPLMVFGEMITGGHYLEVLRLGKQMTIGKSTGPTYTQLHTNFVGQASGNFLHAFYRGFLPWGLIQCSKGIPVLFVQHETYHFLSTQKHSKNSIFKNISPSTAETMSGIVGGAAQAIFVCPFQKVKVSVVACTNLNSMTPWQAIKSVIKKHGIFALYDGVLPMMVRRSMDWGIRFAVSSKVKETYLEYKQQNNKNINTNNKLTPLELIMCGFIGGACSALTHPIDNIITNCQKPVPNKQFYYKNILSSSHHHYTPIPSYVKNRDVISVIRRMVWESGYRAFTRGWSIKVLDNAYHMAWMYGIGTIVYDYLHKASTIQ